MIFFLSKGLSKEYKHRKLALNFVKKHNFSLKKTHFPFILVEQEHREPGKSCF